MYPVSLPSRHYAINKQSQIRIKARRLPILYREHKRVLKFSEDRSHLFLFYSLLGHDELLVV